MIKKGDFDPQLDISEKTPTGSSGFWNYLIVTFVSLFAKTESVMLVVDCLSVTLVHICVEEYCITQLWSSDPHILSREKGKEKNKRQGKLKECTIKCLL